MTLTSSASACLPFSGRDGRSYYMDEQGRLVRVNFKEESSHRLWASLSAGRLDALPEAAATEELRLALERLKPPAKAARQPVVSICGDGELSARLEAALALSDVRAAAVREPKAASRSDCLIVAAGYFRPTLFRQAEEACRAANVPWAPFYLEGKEVRFGPLMGPYLTLADLTARLLSASLSPDVLQDLWRCADDRRFPGLPFSPAEERWLWATVALLLTEWEGCGGGAYPADRYQWTIRPAIREAIAHPVLRLPSSGTAAERRTMR